MTDVAKPEEKAEEEFATVLLLAIGSRTHQEVVAALARVYGDEMWKLTDAALRHAKLVTYYNESPADIREHLAQGYDNPEDGETPEQFVASVTDEDIYSSLMNIGTPDMVYEAMRDMIEGMLREEYRVKGLIENIPQEVTEAEGGTAGNPQSESKG